MLPAYIEHTGSISRYCTTDTTCTRGSAMLILPVLAVFGPIVLLLTLPVLEVFIMPPVSNTQYSVCVSSN